MCYDGPQGINSFSLLGLCNYVISICFLIPFSSGREGTQRNEVSLRGLLPIPFISSLILLPLSHITNVYSLQTYVLWPTRLFCLWDSPGKNIGVDVRSLLQGIFPTQRWNPCLLRLLHCIQVLYC